MPTLSLAMIVKDEAETLGHCLASVRDLVDQIVVLDTGSGDGTPDLARALGAEVHAFPWGDDFSAARNAGLARCTGDWVLVLDADEAVDALDHRLIRAALAEGTYPAFRLTLRNYFLSGDQVTAGVAVQSTTGPYQEGRGFPFHADHLGLRLFQRMEGLAFVGTLHELLDPWFEARGLPIGTLGAVIHHYGKTFPQREARKRGYYLHLARAEAQARPDDLQVQFNLLQQESMAGHWEEVRRIGRRCLDGHPEVPSFVLLATAVALQNLEDPAGALPLLDRILAHEPGNAPALVRKGVSQALLGRPAEARDSFQGAIARQPSFILSYQNLAELELTLGNLPQALAAVHQGLDASPSDPRLLDLHVQLTASRGDLDGASAAARQALSIHPSGGQGLWHRLAALGLAQAGQRDEAVALLQQGRTLFPEDPELARLQAKLGG